MMKGFLMSPDNRNEKRSSTVVSEGGTGNGSSGSGSGSGDPASPMQVVLAKGTFLKFAITVGTTVVLGISALLAVYWQHHYRTTAHMDNGTIHLKSGERAVFETKLEAQQHRTKLVADVKQEVEFKHRSIKLSQGEEIKKEVAKLTQDLRTEQKAEFKKLFQEVKQTRREVARGRPAY
jgi:hypothetical protein